MAKIATSHLSVTFPDGTTGLRDINLSIEPGELIALVGPSGSGNADLGNGVRWAHGNDHDAACGNLCAYFTG